MKFPLGADFTAAKGILALINEFTMRKQPLYFLNARKEVLSIFQGVMQGDFKYFKTNEELESQLEGETSLRFIKSIKLFYVFFYPEHTTDSVEERDNLLSFTREYFPKSDDKNVELKEVTSGEGSSMVNRRKNSS